MEIMERIEEQTCGICLDALNDNIYTTECNHIYHRKCLDEWIVSNDTCPICRGNIREYFFPKEKLLEIVERCSLTIEIVKLECDAKIYKLEIKNKELKIHIKTILLFVILMAILNIIVFKINIS